MSKATIYLEGFAAEPRRSQTQAGKDVLTVAVAHTPRRRNRDTGEWEDAGPTTWFEAAFWDQDVHTVGQVVSKGTLVQVSGQPELNVFTKQDGTAGATVRLKFPTLGVIPRETRAAQPQGAPQGAQEQSGWATTQPGDSNAGASAFPAYGDSTPF